MSKLKLFFIGILCSIMYVSCTNDTTIDPVIPSAIIDTSKAYEAFGVSYGDDDKQEFDLFLPANRTEATKTIILVHGGGWRAGDKSDMESIKLLISNEIPDVAIVNMNYKLADDDNPPYPMQINDITRVVDFLKANQTKYSISEDIGFIGTSAGAHLALLWSYAFDSNRKVDMVCSIVGPTNFTDPSYLNTTDPTVQGLLDLFEIGTDTSFLEEVSPFHQVTATAPPTILFYGGQDPLIPTSQGIDLRDKLQNLGVTHEFTLYENEGHGWEGLALLDTWTKLDAFIELYL